MRGPLTAGLMLAAFVGMQGGSARPEEPVQIARLSLERARTQQGEILKSMSDLMQGRQRSASTVELINALTQVHQMELAVLRRIQGMVARTFGQSIDAISEADRQAIDQLAVDQRSVRQRLGDWTTAFTRYADTPNTSEGIRRMQARASQSPAGELMDKTVEHVSTNHLADAVTVGQQSADELARLVQSLEALTTGFDQLLGKRIRELQEIVEQQKRVRGHMVSPPASVSDWQRLRREQDEVVQRTRLMTFEETAMPPDALERVRAAHVSMQSAQASLRQRKHEEAGGAAETAIAILLQAIQLLQASATTGKDPDLPPVPFFERWGQVPIPMQGAAGQGVPLPDMNAIAQLAADIAMLAKIRRAQSQLHAEAIGRVPPMPDPADRQLALAGQLPPLIRRVDLYLQSASTALESARGSMNGAIEQLRAANIKAAAEPQARALEQLTRAEGELADFWKKLLEALSQISSGAPGVAAAGASDKENDKARIQLMMRLLPELIRLGQLVKDLDALIAKTRPWTTTAPAESEAGQVAAVAKEQRALAATGTDIAVKMEHLGELAAGTVPHIVREAVEFMSGAADALDDSDFEKANGRQMDALDILRHAWTIVASSMASLSDIDQSNPNQPGTTPGQASVGTGEGGGGTSESVAGDKKPWFWDLPPRAKEAIAQSLAEPYPPEYETAVKRYFERLSNGKTRR